MKKLVVVESPAKAKTINRYLGDDYKVEATMGHIKDLPKSGLNVEIEKDYEPNYDVVKGKEKTISKLKKLAPKSQKDVYLALDPDREGEAIAAHVAEVLKMKDPNRVVFHEITEGAIKEAMENPQKIDDNLVDAQKARRVLDRLVGYKLSGLLWKKIWYGLSAGRVQSVATRLIVERERERDAFKPDEFWKILAHLTKDKIKFEAELEKRNGKKYSPGSEKETKGLLSDLKKSKWSIFSFSKDERENKPSAPFKTSTLQQAANNYLGYGAKRTMQIAQQLYQGVNIKGEGNVGLITYMRTDSLNLSDKAIDSMSKYIEKKFGKEYLPEKKRKYKTKSKSAQEAHEAIRPTHFDLPPSKVKDSLTSMQHKLYKLIWDRTLASQMANLKYYAIDIDIEAKHEKDSYLFDVDERQMIFDGYTKVWKTSLFRGSENPEKFDDFKKGDKVTLGKIDTEQKFTKPRARYTEATLIKALEKYGIGRPSTYSTIITTIQSRGYVDKEERYLLPTDVGFVVNDFIVKHFSDTVDYDFTSEIEEDLDDVAAGEKEWVPVVDKVFKPLSKLLKEKEKEVDKNDVVILGKSDKKCPDCDGKMVIRIGKNGKFLSCAKFPECKGILDISGKTLEESVDMTVYAEPERCKECEGKMIIKNGKYGKFWACENYPDCKSTEPLLLREKCPECGSNLVEKKGRWGKTFIGCNGYPDCKYIKKQSSSKTSTSRGTPKKEETEEPSTPKASTSQGKKKKEK